MSPIPRAKLLKQVTAVFDVGRWILFQYLIVFVPCSRHPIRLGSIPYISETGSSLSICKAFQSYNFTKTLKTLQSFRGALRHRKGPIRPPQEAPVGKHAWKKKEEINCQLLKIILIMLILFLLHHSLYALRLHHI